MLQYVCDTCGTIKQAGEPWILGFAVERLGTTAMSRDITLAPAWDENKAVQWFAVHFCSVGCKDEYVRKLFGRVAPEEAASEQTLPKATDVFLTRRKSRVPAKTVGTKTTAKTRSRRAS